jgi:hypothetical protein
MNFPSDENRLPSRSFWQTSTVILLKAPHSFALSDICNRDCERVADQFCATAGIALMRESVIELVSRS